MQRTLEALARTYLTPNWRLEFWNRLRSCHQRRMTLLIFQKFISKIWICRHQKSWCQVVKLKTKICSSFRKRRNWRKIRASVAPSSRSRISWWRVVLIFIVVIKQGTRLWGPPLNSKLSIHNTIKIEAKIFSQTCPRKLKGKIGHCWWSRRIANSKVLHQKNWRRREPRREFINNPRKKESLIICATTIRTWRIRSRTDGIRNCCKRKETIQNQNYSNVRIWNSILLRAMICPKRCHWVPDYNKLKLWNKLFRRRREWKIQCYLR